MAVEIQHLSGVILERVNRFFGWQAVGSNPVAASPARRAVREFPQPPDPQAWSAFGPASATSQNDDLRDALARLGAAIKQS